MSTKLIGTSSLDYVNFGRYSLPAAAKSVAGVSVPKFTTAHNRASGFFMCEARPYLRIMVGRAGASKDAPGSVVTGNANPVRFTTLEISVSGGELKHLTTEAAIMATIPAQIAPTIFIENGRAITTSIAIAEFFHKLHKNVIQKIENLDCSPQFTELNFKLSEYADPTGRKLPAYQITRDGFAFLAMGFTGKRAARFKEDYINAFNKMESRLLAANVPSAQIQAAEVLWNYSHIIKSAWDKKLQPMLVAADSPLAVTLHDYINDTCFAAALLHASLQRAVGRKI